MAHSKASCKPCKRTYVTHLCNSTTFTIRDRCVHVRRGVECPDSAFLSISATDFAIASNFALQGTVRLGCVKCCATEERWSREVEERDEAELVKKIRVAEERLAREREDRRKWKYPFAALAGWKLPWTKEKVLTGDVGQVPKPPVRGFSGV